MQSAFGTTPPSRLSVPPSGPPALDRATYAAIVTLARSIEVRDPGLARRAAMRAAVVERAAPSLALDPADLAAALAGALLADVAAIVTHVRPGPDEDVTAAVLGANLLDRVGVRGPLSAAVRQRAEHWDGGGAPLGLAGDAIAVGARVAAIAHVLVGPLEAGGTPHWTSRAGRARSLAGSVLDPRLVVILADAVTKEPAIDDEADVDLALAALSRMVAGGADESPIEALTSIGAAIHAADRVDEVLSLIAGHVRRALRASTVGIVRLDPGDHVAVVVAESGDLAAATTAAGTTIPLDAFPPGGPFRGGDLHDLRRHDVAPDSAEARHLDAHGAEAELAVPLDVDGHRWGVLWARRTRGDRPFGARDLGTLRLAATQITASVEQATRVADLEALALRDPLTGLGNRRVLETTLRRIFARPPVARQDCAVIICDVDGLKVVNDTEGHSAGDAVLVDAAAALRHAVSGVSGATVCRIGGDEFCIVLDGGGMLHGEPIAAQAQRLFARSGVNRSMSCGVAVASIGVNAPGDLLRAADEAQYLQKRGRRGISDDELLLEIGGRGGRRARRDR